ncbi:helix-turn-helix domain-containing protein [Leptolyngbya sp. NIES-2104]|uniref:helix-turn-helix domain-containing protein n=1 Tax=Leptolyngbya sp. NIES-2104 TaxID=1552121 RepID=UPI0006EC8EAB|nr:helix-turn-helix transcriptional regulator [Leptolyngbya sp. NIES-2104]GAP93621.1 transcriptional Regulator, XRE family [Leptolyngbya sp. NIES-2104]
MEKKQANSIKWRFGKAIRRRRRELDLTQEQLAERAELHRSYLATIETGDRNPSLENIEKLAKALDISIADFFAQYNIESSDEA